MKRPTIRNMKTGRAQKVVLGTRAFEAITAVEGLRLSPASKQRLKRLEGDASLTPAEKRDAVVRAYVAMSKKK